MKKDNTQSIFIGVFLVILFLIITISIYVNTQTNTVQTEVTDKAITVSSNGEGGVTSVYKIYTEKGTFTLVDTLIGWNFDTADDYGKIKKGECYEFYVRGVRVPLLSMMPNIETATPIKCEYVLEY